MNDLLREFAQFLGTGWLHDHVVLWLRTVPGLPPIVQTVHILGISCVIASIVMIDLRVLGWALPSQQPREMMRRLMPWLWTALVFIALSGAMFVIARPRRYFANPIFGIKFALLFASLLLTVWLFRLHRNSDTTTGSMRALAGASLLTWIGVVLAGRWIAYADYLISPQ